MLSHRLWQDHFGADPAIIGKSITLENQGRHAWEVVGVMPPGFNYPGSSLWVSAAHMPGPMTRRGGALMQVMARLKPGVTLQDAESEMNVIQARIHHAHSHLASRGKYLAMGSRVKIEPMLESMVGNVRWSLQLFFVAVVFVLLIACANVANLLLARACRAGARSPSARRWARAEGGLCANCSRKACCCRCSAPRLVCCWRSGA